jgi:hypothetical protein
MEQPEVCFVIVTPGLTRGPAFSARKLKKSGIPGQARDDVHSLTTQEARTVTAA